MPARADRPTLFYDGECGFCRDAVAVLSRWDREGRIELIPFQDAARVAQFGLPLPALAAAMHLAVPELGRLLPGKRWLTWLFAVPGVRPIARRAYAWIAARRRCLVPGRPAG